MYRPVCSAPRHVTRHDLSANYRLGLRLCAGATGVVTAGLVDPADLEGDKVPVQRVWPRVLAPAAPHRQRRSGVGKVGHSERPGHRKRLRSKKVERLHEPALVNCSANKWRKHVTAITATLRGCQVQIRDDNIVA